MAIYFVFKYYLKLSAILIKVASYTAGISSRIGTNIFLVYLINLGSANPSRTLKTPLPLSAAASSLTSSLTASRDRVLKTTLDLPTLYRSVILSINRY